MGYAECFSGLFARVFFSLCREQMTRIARITANSRHCRCVDGEHKLKGNVEVADSLRGKKARREKRKTHTHKIFFVASSKSLIRSSVEDGELRHFR